MQKLFKCGIHVIKQYVVCNFLTSSCPAVFLSYSCDAAQIGLESYLLRNTFLESLSY